MPANEDRKTSVSGTPEDSISAPDPVVQFPQALAAAVEIGQAFARRYRELDRQQRSHIARAIRAQLLPPGRRGSKRKKEITAAHEDWRAGMRGVELCRKHIPGYDKMGYWKRKAKGRTLMSNIHTRERRDKAKRQSPGGQNTESCTPNK
jgi:hypothetical protein